MLLVVQKWHSGVELGLRTQPTDLSNRLQGAVGQKECDVTISISRESIRGFFFKPSPHWAPSPPSSPSYFASISSATGERQLALLMYTA